jgi:hypothetical protein
MAGQLEPFLSRTGHRPTAMNEIVHIDVEGLAHEALRYLAAVDAFRAERSEPMWRPELVPSIAPRHLASLTRPSAPRGGAARRQA